MFFGCCTIIPSLKRTRNGAVAVGTPQNQTAKDSRSPVRLRVPVYYSSNSKDVYAIFFSYYVGTFYGLFGNGTRRRKYPVPYTNSSGWLTKRTRKQAVKSAEAHSKKKRGHREQVKKKEHRETRRL